jgi:hypothetical protein
MKNKIISYLGWYGVFAILLAYALLNFNTVSSKSYVYQLLNLTGALGIVVEAISKKDRQPATLNLAWAAVAFVAIVRLAAG